MKLIRELSEMIEDEIDGARDYIKMALELKADHRDLADGLYQISTEELGHIDRLHEYCVRLIEKYKAEKGEPPATMMAVYEYLHKKHIDRVKEIRVYQNMYREN